MEHKKTLKKKRNVVDNANHLYTNVPSCVSVSNKVGLHSTYIVDMDNVRCTCAVADQIKIPCRHILAVLKKKEEFHSTINFIHESYKIEQIRTVLEGTTIIMPPTNDGLNSSSIRPPPRYNNGGHEDATWTNGPGRKQTRRFASKGEFRSDGKVFSTRSLYSLPQAGCPSSYDMTTDNQLLLSSVSGPVQKKRKEYQCKRCGENGHNASTCKNLVDSIPSKSVKSGSYVVGSDPTTCLGLDRKIYVENGQKIEYRDNELQKAVKKILACTLVFGEDEFFATCEDILKLVQQTDIDTATDVLCKAIVCPKCIFHISSIPGSFERYLRGLLPVNCNMYMPPNDGQDFLEEL